MKYRYGKTLTHTEKRMRQVEKLRREHEAWKAERDNTTGLTWMEQFEAARNWQERNYPVTTAQANARLAELHYATARDYDEGQVAA